MKQVNAQFKGKWESSNKRIGVNLPLILFTEENTEFAYCPALNLTGYGETETDAMKSFEVVLGEYLLYTTRKKTLLEDLKQFGWAVRKTLRGSMRPPTMESLLKQNDEFSRIFNTHNFKKVSTHVEMPAFA